jgi:hypothetical protein
LSTSCHLEACLQGALVLALVGCGPEGHEGQARDAVPRAPRAVGQAGWDEVHTGGVPGKDSPTAGEDGAVAHDPIRHRVLLYGGKGDDDVNGNELWAFDLETRAWSRLPATGTPPPREDHTMIFDQANDQLVVFGGEDGPTSQETWAFDFESSHWTDITHDSAPFLEGHTAEYDPKGLSMIVFGGGSQKIFDDKTWVLDLDKTSESYGTWETLDVPTPRPQARREHSSAYDPTRHVMYVFGGRQRTKDSHLNDVWAYDPESRRWREVVTTGEHPDPIRQTVVGLNPDTNELSVFGGEILVHQEGDFEDYIVNRIWVLDMESGVWSDRTPYPRSVYDHVGLYVPELGGTLVYGGSSTRDAKEHGTWLLRRIDASGGTGQAVPVGSGSPGD